MQAKKTDSQIQLNVLNELRWDSRVRATEIGVEVSQGIVTLSGSVDSYAKKVAARQAAHRVIGVLDVADALEVVIPGEGTRTDADIAAAVRSALMWNVLVPNERITTTVSDGWLTLDGEVDRWTQRMDAETAVRDLQGVRGVTNMIRINARHVDPVAVRTSIEEALERRAAREARRIGIEVDYGTGAVTLSGTVHDWAEEQEIVQVASHATGVRSVKDELHIDLFSR
jgi:osmotically-inducible protein OsmY